MLNLALVPTPLMAPAVAAGEPALRAGHSAWWEDFWAASAVALPDARLEGFYALQVRAALSAPARASAFLLDCA